MSILRRLALASVVALVLAVAGGPAPAAAADDVPGTEDNAAVAVNTEDGASVFRLAFSVVMVANGVVDQTNAAYALARCSDCQTVALAFQVVLVIGDAAVVTPENTAVAYNDQCSECLTYASATQIVLGFDGPVRFTAEGRQRLAALYSSLKDLEEQVGSLSASELNAAVAAAKAELVSILSTELVEVTADTGAGGSTTTEAPSTTTTAPPGTSTIISTSTTTATSSSTTSSPSSSTTTEAPTTTAVPSTTSTTGSTTTTDAPSSTTSTTAG